MKKTVLIIDDEESVLEFLSGLVDSMGCRAICSRSADAAREFLPECDMVLSDIRIGFENGIEFLQSLREQGIESRSFSCPGVISSRKRKNPLSLRDTRFY